MGWETHGGSGFRVDLEQSTQELRITTSLDDGCIVGLVPNRGVREKMVKMF
jgi:hypothetical protein